mgnify:CR=1 FL=1
MKKNVPRAAEGGLDEPLEAAAPRATHRDNARKPVPRRVPRRHCHVTEPRVARDDERTER